MTHIDDWYTKNMDEKKDETKKKLLDAYKKIRKPAAPPERVIPDKRDKMREDQDEEEIKDVGD